jgi:hypothetical protein
MNSVMAQVAELGVISAPAPEALKVGHINHASALYSAFVVDAEKQGLSTLDTIREIALTSKLSCVEFSAQVKAAQEIADTVDKGNGFEKPEGAKGQESYGPKRRLLNQRTSEAKRLFGVYKLSPDTLAEKGYWPALTAARDYLIEHGIKWDGAPDLSAEEKSAKRASQVRTNARALAMDCNPQKKDESDDAYLIRVRDLMAQAVEAAEDEEFNKGIKTLHDSLTKKHNPAVLAGVMQMMLESMSTEDLEALQSWVQEELVCRVVQSA